MDLDEKVQDERRFSDLKRKGSLTEVDGNGKRSKQFKVAAEEDDGGDTQTRDRGKQFATRFVAPAPTPLHFFGVYDGHGRSQASIYCKNCFHKALAEKLRDASSFSRDLSYWNQVMSARFMKMDTMVDRRAGERILRDESREYARRSRD
ncbi:hypothetical protein SUGI_0393970 [Cryptomeria japonica]|nr:hypothetical protein SUGI_0393970 [Cryptomeria japonica]